MLVLEGCAWVHTRQKLHVEHVTTRALSMQAVAQRERGRERVCVCVRVKQPLHSAVGA